MVIAFLEKFFSRYVEYDFTARLEGELDRISDNMIDWKKVLGEFWEQFYPKTEEVLGVSNTEVIETLNEFLGPFLFGEAEEGKDPRKCPACDDGRLSLRTGKYGAFVGCSNYPECGYTRPFGHAEKAAEAASNGEDGVLGQDPDTGFDVVKKDGRFGAYIQLDEPKEKGKKPKRSSIPKDVDADSLTLEMALKLLSLPRTVGDHPETGKPITASIGRYGPYVAHDGSFASISSTAEVFEVGVNRAVAALADAAAKKRGGTKKVLKELGDHPDGGPVNVLDGRYGPYVNHGRVNATLPKGTEPESVTMEQALEWLAEKAKKKKPARKKKAAPKKKKA